MLNQTKFRLFTIKSLTLIILVTIFLCSSLFAQWTLQGTVNGLGKYPSISVYSPTGLVVAAGLSGAPKVFKSTNSGINWTDITGNISGPELFCVWAVDGNVIYAGDGGSNGGAGGDAKVWKTTNGGVNWTTILTTGGSSGFINGIVFSRTMPSFGIIQSDAPNGAGQPYWLAKTTNGGDNWVITNVPGISNSYSVLNTVIAIDNSFYGFGLVPDANVNMTSNGGTTWNNLTLGLTGFNTAGLAFSSDKIYGIAVSNESLPIISRTTNGGANWLNVNTGGSLTSSIFSRMKWVHETSICFLTGESGTSGTIMKSTDNGATWVTQTTSGIEGLTHLDLVYNSGTIYAYAVSSNGSVIKLQQLTGIEPVNSKIPGGYRIYQNYPNPFNPTTNIKFDLPGNSFVNLRIFDMMGREVATLVNEQLQSGNYETEWNAAGIPGGTYFYKLTANDYSETMKMILIK